MRDYYDYYYYKGGAFRICVGVLGHALLQLRKDGTGSVITLDLSVKLLPPGIGEAGILGLSLVCRVGDWGSGVRGEGAS